MRNDAFNILKFQYRMDILAYVQAQHLSASLFSLDEILITPLLLARPPIISPDFPPPHEDIISTLIPYTPDWPEMATAYKGKTLDVLETVQHVDKLAIIGNPGSGKTTALCHIASSLSRHTPNEGTHQNFIPLYINLADVDLPQKESDNPQTAIINGISYHIPNVTRSRLSEMLENSFHQGEIILLFDGLDETFSNEMKTAVEFIKSILTHYPKIKIVVAACPNHLSDLPRLGFQIFSMIAWDSITQAAFVRKWNNLWRKYIEDADKINIKSSIDPSLIDGWLLNLESAVTPLDFTLKVWAAYAGDSLGPSSIDSIEAFIRRISVGIPKSRSTLSLLATIIALKMESTFSTKEAKKWLLEGKKEAHYYKKEKEYTHGEKYEISVWEIGFDALPGLIEAGIFNPCGRDRLKFFHPIFLAYLAGSSIPAEEMQTIIHQPSSCLKNCIKTFFPYHPILDNYIHSSLTYTKDPLLQDYLTIGRWLPHISQYPQPQKWIIDQFIKAIQNDMLSKGIQLRLLTALVTSKNPSIPERLIECLDSENNSIRQLAVLGIGYLRDIKSIKLLEGVNSSQTEQD